MWHYAVEVHKSAKHVILSLIIPPLCGLNFFDIVCGGRLRISIYLMPQRFKICMNFEMETFRKSLAHGSFLSFAVKKLKTPICTHTHA